MRWKVLWRLWLPLAGIGLFLWCPEATRTGVREGLALCGSTLIPALFPVSVLAGCLIRTHPPGKAGKLSAGAMGALFGLPGEAALPLLLGLLGGFPLGAQLTATAYESGHLSKQHAARLAGLSNNAGPAFLLGAVGTMLNAPAAGAALLFIQLGSVLLCGLLLREKTHCRKINKKSEKKQPPSPGAVLPLCIGESAAAMLRLAGAVAFFQAVLACLKALFPLTGLPLLWQAGLSGALELTGGLALFRGSASPALLPLTAAMIGWGGLCVHLQAAQALSRVGLPMGPYLRCKALQAVAALLLSLCLICVQKITGILPVL